MGTNLQEKGLALITSSKTLILNTVGRDGYPNSRILYSHANDEFAIYFSTATNSEKVADITENCKVSAYYENTAQELSHWKNAILYGNAVALKLGSEEYKKAVSLISKRSENFRKRAEDNLLGENTLFKITPYKVKVLDFAATPRVDSFEIKN